MNKYMKVKLGFATACCAMALAGSAAVTNQVATVEGLWDALTNSTCDVIALADGEYKLASQLTLNRAVTVLGGGYSDCTLLQTNKGCRVVLISHEDARLEGVTVRGGNPNSKVSGAGIFMSKGKVVRCRITGNKQLGNGTNGAGVYASGGTILQCVIDGNGHYYAGSYPAEGGGVYLAGATTVDSCLITNNLSDSGWWQDKALGGGIYVTADGCSILNSTIVGNRSAHKAGGLYSTTPALTVKNCIIAGNTCRLEDTNDGYPNWSVSNVANWEKNVSNCFWADEGLSRCIGKCSKMGDPMFTDAAAGDYTLAEYSQAIGLGAYYDGIPDDLVGTPRRNPPDVGCFQSSHPLSLACAPTFGPERALAGTTFSLTSGVANARSGATYDYYWVLTDLEGVSRRFAVSDPVVPDLAPGDYEVFLAVSNRAVSVDSTCAYATNRLLVCSLTNYVTSVTGATPIRPYARPGAAATSIHDALALTYPGSVVVLDEGTHAVTKEILLDKKITVAGAGREKTILRASAKKFRMAHLNDAEAVMRDLTIAGGYFGGDSSYRGGTGAFLDSKGGRLLRCGIVGNTMCGPNRSAGALLMYSTNSIVDGCVISHNTNLLSSANYSIRSLVDMTAGTIRNSIICNNFSSPNGLPTSSSSGHIVNANGKNCLIENCTIVNNVDECPDGCAVALSGSYQNAPRLYNTILAGNVATQVSATEESPLPNLRASGASYYFDVRNCCYVGSAAFGTDSFVATDAKFVDAANGDYRLRSDSPCRNKGLTRDWMTGALDVYGQPRICGKRVDIGAAECLSGLTILIR